MCEYCGLINAIDRYIEKAESKLEEVFEEEERANPKKMVRDISLIEKLVTGALLSETEYFIAEIRKKKNLKQVKESLKKINDGDKCFEVIKQKLKEEFRNIIEENAELYIKRTDSELRIKNLSKRTVNWVESWSGELANIMRLNSHREIEEILRKGLKNGDGVDVFTRNILESGIRDEYYKARRVAVTEVLRAHNVAQQEAFMQDPSVSDKMWRHTGEYRNEPRQNHVDMDGQIVKKDEPFELIGKDGGVYYPMQPCDSSLPPEESVNCHCICQPVVNEETLGLSLEERQRLQQEAIDEMDDSWEKELDNKNRTEWEKRNREETDKREFEDNRKNGVDNFGGNDIMRERGALTSKNDPDEINRIIFAESYYQEIRNRDKNYEVKAVAKNSGFSEKAISKVYDHVFINKYELIGGYKTFDPDYNMAQSWQRLREGKNIQPHDITMLKHEKLEYDLMRKTGRNYNDAHNLTIRKYDYNKELSEYLDKNNLR